MRNDFYDAITKTRNKKTSLIK
ncbi:hypothetical protein, partial [Borreliella garinii]